MAILELSWIGWVVASIVTCWLLPGRWRPWGIAAFALAFLSLEDPPSAFILAAMAAIAWWSGARGGERRLGVAAVVVLLLGVLAVFKAASTQGGGFAMPLGMSYYTFRCVHYALERFKKSLPPHTAAEFLAYLFFLPTLIAGPIHRFPEFHRDLRRTRLDGSLLSEGFERVLYGYVKILVVSGWMIQGQLQPWIADLRGRACLSAASPCWRACGTPGWPRYSGHRDRLSPVALGSNLRSPRSNGQHRRLRASSPISLTRVVRGSLYTPRYSR